MGTDHKNSSSKVKKPELIPLKALVVIELENGYGKNPKNILPKVHNKPPFHWTKKI